MAPNRPPRALICALFLRLFGCISFIAFTSLLVQVDVLYGRVGLLPIGEFLASLSPGTGFVQVPTIFWIAHSDVVLRAAAAAGAMISLCLIANLAPRYCLLGILGLYLSFATAGQEFLSFQWDNLLLETAFFSLFIAPGGWRPRPREPHRLGLFLMQWLLFRLNVESGAAKLLSGDPTWRDLTAMVSYYETAPLPTWIGWYAHQLPVWFHRATAAATYVVELGAPWLMWGPRRLRFAGFCALASFQLVVILTANYGFFNYLSLALALFMLDDDHLRWLTRGRFGTSRIAAPEETRSPHPARTALFALIVGIAVPVSLLPFLGFVPLPANLRSAAMPLQRILYRYRIVNAYHLFAQMTLERREVVIEGSADGIAWQPYEFRYKPGDPTRAPRFVAPHQPRVDFQLWFLLLGGPPRELYFHSLLERLIGQPRAVSELFVEDPFPDTPPAYLRVTIYRYQFTDSAKREATGEWWKREYLGQSAPLTADALGAGG